MLEGLNLAKKNRRSSSVKCVFFTFNNNCHLPLEKTLTPKRCPFVVVSFLQEIVTALISSSRVLQKIMGNRRCFRRKKLQQQRHLLEIVGQTHWTSLKISHFIIMFFIFYIFIFFCFFSFLFFLCLLPLFFFFSLVLLFSSFFSFFFSRPSRRHNRKKIVEKFHCENDFFLYENSIFGPRWKRGTRVRSGPFSFHCVFLLCFFFFFLKKNFQKSFIASIRSRI